MYQVYSTGLDLGDWEVLCSIEGLLAKKGKGGKQFSLHDSNHNLFLLLAWFQIIDVL